jgi:hypothetical protein
MANTATLTFRKYIARRRVTDDAAGDFVRDAKSALAFRVDDPDGRLPLPDAQRWPELREYLHNSGARPEAISAGAVVWGEYVAARGPVQRKRTGRKPPGPTGEEIL